MLRFFTLLVVMLTPAAVGCTVSTAPSGQSTRTHISSTRLSATALPPSGPTATNDATLGPTAVLPTETPTMTAQDVVIEGDCAALKRPLTHTPPISTIHTFMSLINDESCALQVATEQRFFFGDTISVSGIYGVLSTDNTLQQRLVRVDFDGTIVDLNATVGGFYGGQIMASSDNGKIMWSDGDTNPNNSDEFLARLWIANSDGSDQHIIYEHTTDLAKGYIEILMPIGFLPNGNVLFSIEPAGRGGGWVYTGDHSNLYQTATHSVEKRDDDHIFTCPKSTSFCIGDFTDDLSHFAYTDSEKQTLYVVVLATGTEVWQTTVTDHTFIGRPQFNATRDLAFVAVDVVNEGHRLRPENGYIGVIDFPYTGEVKQAEAELATDIITWIDDEHILYYELTSNSNGDWRYPIINRNGEEIGMWQSDVRFPTVIK